MGQTVNHNYSVETQYEVLVRAGKLPVELMETLPHALTAAQVHTVANIFDAVTLDPNFPKYLKAAVDKVETDKDAKTRGAGEQLTLKPQAGPIVAPKEVIESMLVKTPLVTGEKSE